MEEGAYTLKKPQLLAPAGDFSSLDAALNHGADAVYVGVGQFNLRAHAPNFTLSDCRELLDRVHSDSKEVYYTFNTMPDCVVLSEMESMVRSMAQDGTLPDGFIVSDPGVVTLCRELAAHVPLHLSTQTGTFNERAMRFWREQGIRRVVLPRELSIKKVAALSEADIMETEIFIHGAMCVSISGRCLLGAYLAARHPNLGDCPQPCRWKYRLTNLVDMDNSMQAESIIHVEESGKETYFLNSRDLCTLSILPDLINCGVTCFKIEGRNKSAHYVATVVKTYRAAIDQWFENPSSWQVAPEWVSMLESVEHRPYTTGFYAGELGLQEPFSSKASSTHQVVGVVKGLLCGGIAVIDVKNRFECHTDLEILPVNRKKAPFIVSITELTDICGNPVEYAASNRLVVAPALQGLQIGDMLREARALAPQ